MHESMNDLMCESNSGREKGDAVKTGKGAALENVNQIRIADVQKGQAVWSVLLQCS